VGHAVWFGPRVGGWGWSPVNAVGWAVLGIGIAAILALAFAFPHMWWVSLLAVVAMLTVIFLKGTSPGGREQWREFQASRNDPGQR
jgi:hypothetical protein